MRQRSKLRFIAIVGVLGLVIGCGADSESQATPASMRTDSGASAGNEVAEGADALMPAPELGDPHEPSEAQAQAAEQFADSVQLVRSIEQGGTLVDSSHTLATTLLEAGGASIPHDPLAAEKADGATSEFIDPACVELDGATTRYHDCQQPNGFQVDGEVTVLRSGPDDLTVTYEDLTLTTSQFALSMNGTLAMAPGLINGGLTIRVDASVPGGRAITTVIVSYDDVTYSDCGIDGGRLTVAWGYEVGTVGGIGIGGGTRTGGTAEFTWTACDTFTVRNT